jgi:hypothetical protein
MCSGCDWWAGRWGLLGSAGLTLPRKTGVALTWYRVSQPLGSQHSRYVMVQAQYATSPTFTLSAGPGHARYWGAARHVHRGDAVVAGASVSAKLTSSRGMANSIVLSYVGSLRASYSDVPNRPARPHLILLTLNVDLVSRARL